MPASRVQVRVGGQPTDDRLLELIEVRQELNHHAWCVVEIRQTLDNRFAVEQSLGQDLEVIAWGQDGAEVKVFEGFVLEGSLEYEIYGSYRTRLVGVTQSYRMEVRKREKYWRNQTLSGVAGALASDDGLKVAMKGATDGTPRNYVQWGESDWEFIKRLADDAQCWMRPVKDGVEVCGNFQGNRKLGFRADAGDGLLKFRIQGRLSPQSIEGVHYDPRKMESQRFQNLKGQPDFTGAMGGMVNAARKAAADRLPSTYEQSDPRSPEASDYESLLKRESMRAVGSAFSAYGESRTEALKPGDQVQIEGALDATGLFGLLHVLHRWTRDGYLNQFCCTPWKKWVEGIAPECDKASGVIPARVTDNNDPRKTGRVQVRYDWQDDGVGTAWARMMTPHAGADRGFLFLPEIGDEVLVGFEHGDPERPFILGSLWNGVDAAPRQEFWGGDIDPNHVKRIVTKSGHRIQLSDKPGKEAITIATPQKLRVALYEKTDETGRPMILLHAADGDIVLSAPNGRIHFHSQLASREVGGS